MCGRAKLSSDYSEIRIVLNIPPQQDAPNFAPNWNVAPTQTLPVAHLDKEGRRRIDVMRWGLVPAWAKDIRLGYSTFNAKAEGIETKPVFREAFRRRRCLVPVNAFYEWRTLGPKEKQPYAIGLHGRPIMALAGLWEHWRSADGERLLSFTIVTCPPNVDMAALHNRMPVILPEAAWPAWLGETAADTESLKALMVPCQSADLDIWPVDRRVGNVRYNDASLIERITSI